MKTFSSWSCLLLLLLAATILPACSGDKAGHDAAPETAPQEEAAPSTPPSNEVPAHTPIETDGPVGEDAPGGEEATPEYDAEGAQG